ncbi:hypothetical protein ACIL8I_26905, partial [Escherichia coli]
CIALLPPQNPLRVFAPRSPERPSRHGSGGALSATGNRGGSVVLEIGEQKHARDFEAAKEQCRIDNHGQNVNT